MQRPGSSSFSEKEGEGSWSGFRRSAGATVDTEASVVEEVGPEAEAEVKGGGEKGGK